MNKFYSISFDETNKEFSVDSIESADHLLTSIYSEIKDFSELDQKNFVSLKKKIGAWIENKKRKNRDQDRLERQAFINATKPKKEDNSKATNDNSKKTSLQKIEDKIKADNAVAPKVFKKYAEQIYNMCNFKDHEGWDICMVKRMTPNLDIYVVPSRNRKSYFEKHHINPVPIDCYITKDHDKNEDITYIAKCISKNITTLSKLATKVNIKKLD